MAKRLRPLHQEDVRRKIQASQIINRLENHILNDLEMTSSQVSAAKLLLDKAIANAQPEETPNKSEGKLTLEVNRLGND